MLYGPAIRAGDAMSEDVRRRRARERAEARARSCARGLARRVVRARSLAGLLAALLAFALPVASQATEPQGSRDAVAPRAPGELRDRFDSVIIDAGHGGEDHGAVGPGGLREKDLVLGIAQRLAARLREQGLRVLLTREDDRAVGLAERAERANASGADLFLSLHANAAPSRSVRGVETYFASLEASDALAQGVALRENAAFGGVGAAPPGLDDGLAALLGDLVSAEQLEDSDLFARLAHERLSALDGGTSRGVKQAPFAVLLHVQMPAALIEVGFVTNREEERALASDARRDAIAFALADAVRELARRHDARRGFETPPETKEGTR